MDERAEAKMSGDETRAFFDLSPYPMWVASEVERRFLAVNGETERLYGYTREEFQNLTLHDLFATTQPPMPDGVWFESDETNALPLRHIRKDGTEFWAIACSIPIEYKGLPARAVWVRDATKGVSEVQALRQQKESASSELEFTEAELDRVTAIISHDLRSPVRAISGYSQALIEDSGAVLDATALEYITRIKANVSKVSSMIEDLVGLVRSTRGIGHRESLDLSQLAEDVGQAVVSEYLKREPNRRIELLVEKTPPQIGDVNLLRRLLEALFDNACKFTRGNAVAKIRFGAIQTGNQTDYFVSDDGLGFDPRFTDRMFQPFERLHSNPRFEGNGVGLAYAHRILIRHHGRIWAESPAEPGAQGGATIWFSFSAD